MALHHQQFASWGEFVEHVQTPAPDALGNSSKTGEEWFTETRNFAEAIDLAMNGWKEGTLKAAKLSDPMFEKIASTIERPELFYDVEGMGIDVAAYLEGEPECWQNYEIRHAKGDGHRLIRILYNNAASAGISTATMICKGAAIASLVELLEFAGHRVELVTLPFAASGDAGYRNLKNAAVASVTVKKFEQPLDLGLVMFALAHPSAFRRLGFAWFEHTPKETQREVHIECYGFPAEIKKEVHLLGNATNDILIDSSFFGQPAWENADSVKEWIMKTLKEQGITLRD